MIEAKMNEHDVSNLGSTYQLTYAKMSGRMGVVNTILQFHWKTLVKPWFEVCPRAHLKPL